MNLFIHLVVAHHCRPKIFKLVDVGKVFIIYADTVTTVMCSRCRLVERFRFLDIDLKSKSFRSSGESVDYLLCIVMAVCNQGSVISKHEFSNQYLLCSCC